MSIIEFIKANWIWLVVIVLITIITIIGFLADKKKNTKKEEKVLEPNPNDNGVQPTNNIEPQMPQPVDNSFGVNINNMDTTIRPISENNNDISNESPMNNINNINNMSQEQPRVIPTINNIAPNHTSVENVTSNVTPNQMYQQPITNFSNNINNQEMLGQQVTSPVNQNNNLNNVSTMSQPNFGQPMSNMMNSPTRPQQMPQNQMVNPVPNINFQNSMGQSMPMGNNNFNNTPNFNQNNTTVPQPVNPIPTPQPVRPQPIMGGVNNNQQMMQQNNGNQMQSQPMNQPQQTTGLPVNFVYGSQNNNQNM